MSIKNLSLHSILVLMIVFLLSACSAGKTYKNLGAKNLTVNADFKDITTYLGIHQMTNDCEIHYLGSVELQPGRIELAVPTGQILYLVVAFSSSSFIGGSSNFQYKLTINVQPSKSYELDVSYRDKIYNVTSFEKQANQKQRKAITGTIPQHCINN